MSNGLKVLITLLLFTASGVLIYVAGRFSAGSNQSLSNPEIDAAFKNVQACTSELTADCLITHKISGTVRDGKLTIGGNQFEIKVDESNPGVGIIDNLVKVNSYLITTEEGVPGIIAATTKEFIENSSGKDVCVIGEYEYFIRLDKEGNTDLDGYKQNTAYLELLPCLDDYTDLKNNFTFPKLQYIVLN